MAQGSENTWINKNPKLLLRHNCVLKKIDQQTLRGKKHRPLHLRAFHKSLEAAAHPAPGSAMPWAKPAAPDQLKREDTLQEKIIAICWPISNLAEWLTGPQTLSFEDCNLGLWMQTHSALSYQVHIQPLVKGLQSGENHFFGLCIKWCKWQTPSK